jgi:hypothetical protein
MMPGAPAVSDGLSQVRRKSIRSQGRRGTVPRSHGSKRATNAAAPAPALPRYVKPGMGVTIRCSDRSGRLVPPTGQRSLDLRNPQQPSGCRCRSTKSQSLHCNEKSAWLRSGDGRLERSVRRSSRWRLRWICRVIICLVQVPAFRRGQVLADGPMTPPAEDSFRTNPGRA